MIKIGIYKSIPQEMKGYNNWLVHKKKVPYNPITGHKWQSLEDCVSFSDAVQALDTGGYDGLGFQFSGTPFTGIDLDHHVNDDGSLDAVAFEVYMLVPSYTEYSYSGDGIHIIVKGSVKEGRKNTAIGLEVYSEKRYFTMSGKQVPHTPNIIEDGQAGLDAIYAEYMPTDSGNLAPVSVLDRPIDKDRQKEIDKLIGRILACDYTGKYQALLCEGDTSLYGGDWSSSDMGLMCILAFWCRCDAQLMHDVFNQSALAKRKKWQKGNTGRNPMYYRTLTISKAIAFQKAKEREREERAIEMAFSGI